MNINQDVIQGHWKEIKGKIKQKWGKLTDDEISIMRGSCEELAGALQKRYGYEKEEADEQIKKFTDENDLN